MPAENKKFKGIYNFIRGLTKNNDAVFFGENHPDTEETFAFFAQNPDIFKAAAENGVKHFTLEISADKQHYLDSYRKAYHQFKNGEITQAELQEQREILKQDLISENTAYVDAADLEQHRENMVQTIEHAYDHGMSVWAIDVTGQEIAARYSQQWDQALLDTFGNEQDVAELHQNVELYAVIKDMAQAEWEKAGHTGPVDPVFLKSFIKDNIKDEIASKLDLTPERFDEMHAKYESFLQKAEEIQKEVQVQRSDDRPIHEYIKSIIPAGEKVMGIMGQAHLNNEGDPEGPRRGLDDLYEADGKNVATVELKTKKEREKDKTPSGPDKADLVIDVESGVAYDSSGNVCSILAIDSAFPCEYDLSAPTMGN